MKVRGLAACARRGGANFTAALQNCPRALGLSIHDARVCGWPINRPVVVVEEETV